jgi:hypothetical protein
MSRRLLQLVIPVIPERRMFRIHDPAVDPDAPGGPLPPVGALISTNREQLWVGSLQEDIDVRLVLEEWDGAPPPCGDAWDEEAKSSIYLRGQVSVSMGLAGTAVHGLRLAGGVGDYAVRVYAGNRDVVTRRYAALFDRHLNPLSDEFQQEKRTLEGLERYLVQLWRGALEALDYGPAAGEAEMPVDLAWVARVWVVAPPDEWSADPFGVLAAAVGLPLVLALMVACWALGGLLLPAEAIAVLRDACGGGTTGLRRVWSRNGIIA